MSRLLPGGDGPGGSGAKGVFARDFQGMTPKYAKNNGDERPDNYRDTLCRFFVRVDPNEIELFKRSVSDPVIARDAVLNRLIGDPRGSKGYVDFVLQGVGIPFQELIQVGQALSGNYVAYTFDQTPVTVPLQGFFINSVQDDQATYFVRLYLNLLRATALARRQKVVSLKVDSFILTGALTSLNINLEAKFEVMVPFQMTLLLKRLTIVEYTSSWIPTAVGTPFATDLNAVPMDSRVVVERPIHTSTVRTPNDLDEQIERGETDARVAETPAAPSDLVVSPEEAAGVTDAQSALRTAQSQLVVAEGRVNDLDRRANTLLSDAGRGGDLTAYLATTAERDVARADLARARTAVAAAETEVTAANGRMARPAPQTNVAPTPTPTALPTAVRSAPNPETTGHGT